MANTRQIDRFTFQISAEDVGHMCVGLLDLGHNALSPLSGILESFESCKPAPVKDDGKLSELARKPEIAKALSILTNPGMTLRISTGAGMMDVARLTACRNSSVDRDAVIMITQNPDNSLLIQSFDSPPIFTLWLIDAIASKIVAEPRPVLPESMPFESFIYTLHAIDSFRRAAYESLLEAKPLSEPHISVSKFISTMKMTMQSGDIRWLLPAFISLIPDFASLRFAPDEGHLEFLGSNDLLMPARKISTSEPVFSFGEKGRAVAIDFYRTWWTSAGIEFRIWDGMAGRLLHRSFVASTAVANHFFDIAPDGNGALVVGYRPLTMEDMGLKLQELLITAASAPVIKSVTQAQPVPTVTVPQSPVSAPPGVPDKAACPGCGFMVVIGSTFCSKCGSPIKKPLTVPPPPTQKICASCKKTLSPEAKFCNGCGKPV
jgi:hypothetical protein